MKKYLIYLLIFVCMVGMVSPVYADDEEFDDDINDVSWIYEQIKIVNSFGENEPIINSRSAVIYDRTSGEVIWGKEENSQRKMASTTKIMTSIVVLENVKDLSQIVTISSKSAGVGGSRLRIACG